jgi:transcriptional regulator with XRE-family HTH domain
MVSYSEILAELGHRAKQVRILRNLQQQELATRAGLSPGTLQRFERTGKTSMESALRVATALGVEEDFTKLFKLPQYQSIDEAMAQPRVIKRQRVRTRK